MDDPIDVNRRRWDEMAELHKVTYFADGATIDDDRLHDFEVEEVGDLRGQRICHLQCHLGGDSLSLARLGATVVGVDFSPVAIDAARQRATDAGLADVVSFVCATVDDAPQHVTDVDGVYTSWGVLLWLPDLGGWARTVHRLLRPGGWLHLAETHPYAVAVRRGDDHYGGARGVYEDTQGDYTKADAVFEHPGSWEWDHGIGEVVTALAAVGMRIEWLHEHPVAAWHLGDDRMVRTGRNWGLPGSTLPLSYSLRATRPPVEPTST